MILAEIDDKTQQDCLQKVSHIHKVETLTDETPINDHFLSSHLLTKLDYYPERLAWKRFINFKESAMITDFPIRSFIEYSEDKLMIQGRTLAIILEIDTFNWLKTVNINTNFED